MALIITLFTKLRTLFFLCYLLLHNVYLIARFILKTVLNFAEYLQFQTETFGIKSLATQ